MLMMQPAAEPCQYVADTYCCCWLLLLAQWMLRGWHLAPAGTGAC